MPSISAIIRDLNEFDWRELTDPGGMGAWPAAVKTCVLLFLASALLAGGYLLVLGSPHQRERQLGLEAAGLRTELGGLAASAAALGQYRDWARVNEAPYMRMLRQLPYESEVPALIDEITALGLGFDLEFKSIDLPGERQDLHYVEQPIEIRVAGAYHDLGAFLAGLATVDRIVSSHGFVLDKAADGGLELALQASSYRYRPLPVAVAATAANTDLADLPEPQQPAPFRYAADAGRDPFAETADPALVNFDQESGDSSPLAAYELNELRLVGLLRRGQRHSGLILDPSGAVHRVEAGDYLGRNQGRVEQVSAVGVKLLEQGYNFHGATQAREVLLALEEKR